MPGRFLFPPGSDESEYVLESQVKEKLDAGWEADPTSRVAVDVHGKAVTVSPKDIERETTARRSIPVSSETQEYLGKREELEEEFGGLGGATLALGAGAARGLTFGGSDVLLRGLGVEGETLRGLEEIQPVASTAGELGSILAASLAPGGQGRLAGLLRATPAGKLSTATKGLGEAIGGVRGAVTANTLEGAAYGLGAGISQLAMKDEPLTAEALWQELGTPTLFGAGAGGLLGGTVAIAAKLNKARKGVTAVEQALDASTPEGGQLLGNLSNRIDSFHKTAGDLIDEASGAAGLSKAELTSLSNTGGKLHAFEDTLSSELDTLSKEVANISPTTTGRIEATKAAYRVLRAEEDAITTAAFGKGVNPRFTREVERTQGVLRRSLVQGSEIGRAHAMLAYKNSLKNLAEQAGVDFSPGVLTNLDDAIRSAEPPLVAQQKEYLKQSKAILSEIKAARKRLDTAGGFEGVFAREGVSDATYGIHVANAQAYTDALNRLGKYMGKNTDEIAELLTGPLSLESTAARAVTNLAGDPAVVGGLAASRKAFAKSFGLQEGESFGTKHLANLVNSSQNKILNSLSNLDEYIKQFDKTVLSTGKTSAAQESLTAFNGISETLAKQFELNPKALAEISTKKIASALSIRLMPEFSAPVDDLAKVILAARLTSAEGIKQVAETSAAAQAIGAGTRRGMARVGSAMFSGAARLMGMHGLAVDFMGGAGYSLSSQMAGSLINRLKSGTNAAKATGGVMQTIKQSVGALARGSAKGLTRPGFSTRAVLAANSFGDDGEQPKSLQGLFKLRQDQLVALASNPDALQMTVHESLTPVRQVHLGLGDKMEMQTMNVIGFLNSKLPKDPGLLHRVGVSKWKPSDQDIRRFARYLEGATNPVGTIKKLASGSITPQEAEALRTLWPATFMALQQQIVEQLPEIQKKCTYDQRISLSICMGIPVDTVMRPEFRTFIQQSFIDRSIISSQQTQNAGNAANPEPMTKSQEFDARSIK